MSKNGITAVLGLSLLAFAGLASAEPLPLPPLPLPSLPTIPGVPALPNLNYDLGGSVMGYGASISGSLGGEDVVTVPVIDVEGLPSAPGVPDLPTLPPLPGLPV